MAEQPYTRKGEVVAAIVAGNPTGRLKAVEFDSFGAVRRVEWHDDLPDQEHTIATTPEPDA